MLRLTVLGCRAGSPDDVSPCSGYVIESPSGWLLIDCGPGIATALAQRGLRGTLDGVVLTHVHADHSLDLVALAYGLRFPHPAPRPLPLWLPEESFSYLGDLDRMYGIATLPDLAHPISQAFDVRPLRRDGASRVAVLPDVAMTAYPAVHAAPSAALRFTHAGATLAFSSDTAWAAGALAAATDADVFVCEATYASASAHDLQQHGHLTGTLAGRLAATSGVRLLILTHLAAWREASTIHDQALAAVGGNVPVELATAGATWTVGT